MARESATPEITMYPAGDAVIIGMMSQSDLADISDPNRDQQTGEKQPLAVGLICPSCRSKLTRRSMRRSWQDRVMSVFGRWPYRCMMCSMRFTGPKDPEAIARYNETKEEELRELDEIAQEEAAAKHDEPGEQP